MSKQKEGQCQLLAPKIISHQQNDNSSTQMESQMISTTPATEDKQHIVKSIKNWVTNYCSVNFTTDLIDHIQQELCKLEVTISGKNSNDCTIICFLCMKAQKIYRNANGNWVLSNFHKHFKTHTSMNTKKNVGKNATITSYLLAPGTVKSPKLSLTQSSSSLEAHAHSYSNTTEETDSVIGGNIDSEPTSSDTPRRTQQDTDDNNLSSSPSTQTLQASSQQSSLPSSKRTISVIENIIMSTPPSTQIQKTSERNVPQNLTSDVNSNQNFGKGRIILEGNDSCQRALMPSCSKWTDPKYSRIKRNERSRDRFVQSEKAQTRLTDFYSKMNSIEAELRKIMHENIELKRAMDDKERKNPIIKMDEANVTLLNKLCEITKRKMQNNSGSVRFDIELKKFCTYLYLTGGKLLYETLQANTGIPSVRTIQRIIEAGQVVTEGEFQFEALKQYLTKRNYPLRIWISEDQTAVVNSIQYCSKKNQVIGFTPHLDENGMPLLNGFPFETLDDLYRYFSDETRSRYINLVVAQPLASGAAPFCLAIYGTNNKFCYTDVFNRWIEMERIASSKGIIIEGFSGDGDTRLLKAMKLKSCFPQSINSSTKSSETKSKTKSEPNSEDNECLWFHMKEPYDHSGPLCVQDTVHIGTKLRTRLLKRGIVLPMGDFFVSPEHIKAIILTSSKDKHGLSNYDLNPTDKMNFEAVEKLSDPIVAALLLEHLPESKATAIFLQLIRYILDAFLSKNVSPRERIYKIWVATFFLRIWRFHLKNDKRYSITNNYISLNSYTCIELNAHSLILYTKRCRELKTPYLPWLLSSQPCERTFRQIRSMTSTYSTMVNFSVLEVLQRFNRIQLLNDISCELSTSYVFPRELHRKMGDHMECNKDELPSDEEINDSVNRAKMDSIMMAISLGISVSGEEWLKPIIKDSIRNEEKTVNVVEEEGDETDESAEEDATEDYLETRGTTTLECTGIEDFDENLLKEMNSSGGNLNLKDFSDRRFKKQALLRESG